MNIARNMWQWMRRPWRTEPDDGSEPKTCEHTRELKLVWIGNQFAGKGTMLQAVRMRREEFRDIPGGLRWQSSEGDQLYTSAELMPGTGVPMEKLFTWLTIDGVRHLATLIDTQGGLLLHERLAESIKPEELPDLYSASYGADLLVLALAPDDLLSNEAPLIYGQLVNHVERALLTNPRLMVAVAYTKVDEYGWVRPFAPRMLESARQVRALRRVRNGGERAFEAWMNLVAPRRDPRRAIVELSAELWRQLGAIMPASGLLNGYWTAACQPRCPLVKGWEQKGLGELLADFVAHRRHVAGRALLTWPRVTVAGICAAAVLAVGFQHHAVALQLAHARELTDVDAALRERAPWWPEQDRLAWYRALREITDEIATAAQAPEQLQAPSERARVDLVRAREPVANARAQLQQLASAFVCARNAAADIGARGLPSDDPLAPPIVAAWQALDDSLADFDAAASSGVCEPLNKLAANYRGKLERACDQLLVEGFGRERLAQLRAACLVVLAAPEFLPASPYSTGAHDRLDPIAARRSDRIEVRFTPPERTRRSSERDAELADPVALPDAIELSLEFADRTVSLRCDHDQIVVEPIPDEWPAESRGVWPRAQSVEWPARLLNLTARLKIKQGWESPLIGFRVLYQPKAGSTQAGPQDLDLQRVLEALVANAGGAADAALVLEPEMPQQRGQVALAAAELRKLAHCLMVRPAPERKP
jgi:hypothetical protein